MARKRVVEAPSLHSWEDVNDALRQIAEAQIALGEIQSDKAVSKAGDTYTDIVYIGTLLHFDALLANVAKNPSYKSVRYQGVISFATNGELWDAWESIFTDLSNDNRQEDALEFFQANREAMLEGTAVLWEEKLSYSGRSYQRMR